MRPFKFLLTLVAVLALSFPSFAGNVGKWTNTHDTTVNSYCPGCPNCQPDTQQDAHPAVVQLLNGGAMGTGTLIYRNEREGVILTCSHLFVGRIGGTGVKVTFPNGKTYIGTLRAWDRHPDLAALTIARPDTAPMPVATDPPENGDVLYSAGYGGGRGYRVSAGKMTSSTAPETGRGWFTKSGYSRGGDSGGPIYNQQGRLVGVLHRTEGNTTKGTSNGRFIEFLKVGRYLLPWNAQVEIERYKAQQQQQQPLQPPAYPAPPVPDPQVQARLFALEGKVVELEKIAEEAKQLGLLAGDGLDKAEKAASAATDAASSLKDKVVEAVGKTTGVVEEVSRLRSLVGTADAVVKKIPGVGWGLGKIAAVVGIPTSGAFLIAIAFIFFGRRGVKRDVRHYVESEGEDELAGRRLANRTRNKLDDWIMDKVEWGIRYRYGMDTPAPAEEPPPAAAAAPRAKRGK